MSLDPTLAAAIVTAAGGLLQKLLELGKSSSDTEKKVLEKVYDKVADAVSSNSLRALIVLREIGSYQSPALIAAQAQKLAKRQEPNGKPFESDPEWRLRYLALLGLVRVGRSEFALTRFGSAFIEHAQNDKYRYTKVFTISA